MAPVAAYDSEKKKELYVVIQILLKSDVLE